MRLYFSVMLGIELQEGTRLEWHDGERFAKNEAGTHLVSNAEIVQRIQDVLGDVTRHDDTTVWRVVDIVEGSGIELDGSNSTVIVES